MSRAPAEASLPVAVVTGASRGIGAAILRELAGAGYAVVCNYARSREAADAIVGELTAQGHPAVAVQGDVSLAADRERILDAATEKFGRIDVLVNNAGITSPGRKDLLEVTEASFDEVLGVNLKGPFFLAQSAANRMLAQQALPLRPAGTLLFVSSISAYAVSTDRADYCVAKSAIGMMTRLFAARLADAGIFSYEISPGVIESDMTAPVKAKYDSLIAGGLTPIRRWGKPRDVANLARLLAAGEFAFSTGDCFHVDGGFHVRRL
ncbi:MAG TPA: 3-ketoacyl-ACP reductase [Pirellulaceae bacterium]|jgi:NAD(P)-dependent dehydrogenase (short-subunit alcohol dehydrogenase family)|nr:3-ketoacyl-ACP reductase [Pirellulaceae bacterium]